MSKDQIKSVKLRFEKPADYNGQIVYTKGVHDVPLEKDGIKGWAQRWIARGAVDIGSETAKAEVEAKVLSDKAIAEQKKADEAKEKADKAKADAAAKKAAQQDPPAPAGGQVAANQNEKPEDKKSEDKKDGQDGQKGQASAVVENKQ